MSDLKAGEIAWRITKGKYKGRLCWASDSRIAKAIEDKTKLQVTLFEENVPYYGLRGSEQIKVNPNNLNKVRTVAVWSDQV